MLVDCDCGGSFGVFGLADDDCAFYLCGCRLFYYHRLPKIFGTKDEGRDCAEGCDIRFFPVDDR